MEKAIMAKREENQEASKLEVMGEVEK